MLGGGTFTSQNKVLPGAYINIVSLAAASATISDRGYVAMPLELSWGPAATVNTVTKGDFQKNSLKLFGYAYDAEELKGLRDIFLHAHTLYYYRLNGGGNSATCIYGTAKYPGTRGNDLSIYVSTNVDDSTKFDVKTMLGTQKVDEQKGIATSAALVDCDFVNYDKTATLVASATGTALSGGTDATVTGTEHSAFLTAIEAYAYNALGVVTTDSTTKGLYSSFVERMRDEVGQKFQVVLQDKAADYEGVVNVMNSCSGEGVNAASLVYWVTGAVAGCAVNKSCTNMKYDGEFTVVANESQATLEAAIVAGKFALHNVNNELRVLLDINSLVTTTDSKGDIFKDNQTIRIADTIANDTAALFNNKYLGRIQNNKAGRVSLWADIIAMHKSLQTMGAIEDFTDTDVTVGQGENPRSVVVTDAVNIVSAMSTLYMTVVMG